MPAKSEKQRKLFGIALAMKRGKTNKSYSKEAAEISKELPASKIEEFTHKLTSRQKRKRKK